MKNTDYMSASDIRNTIKSLACSQGYYGRLYDVIESYDDPCEIYEELSNENFRSPADLVMYLEY